MKIALILLAASVMLMNAATVDGPAEFGKLPDGTAIQIYALKNKNGLEASILNYGGIVVSLKAPDRRGQMADIVLGFDSLSGYLQSSNRYFGALIGRYANRIGNARFMLNGVVYHLEKNNGANSLHGGSRGFDKRVWTARKTGDSGLELTYLSKDGEQGYPGNLDVTVVYHLTDVNELRIDYAASTDKVTVLNLTNHSYFNLKGAGFRDILGHLVTINADRFTPVDSSVIPTGQLKDVAGTPFDFRKAITVGARIGENEEQLQRAKGYDHNWVLNRRGPGLALAAKVEDPESGRVLEVLTTEPGIQFYTGNFLNNSIQGKSGKTYGPRSALTLETQHFPDSPNQPNFPSTVLKPGERFESTTVYRFSK